MSEVLEQELTDVLREIDAVVEKEKTTIRCIPTFLRQ